MSKENKQTISKQLANCPFCGGEAEMVVAHHVFEKPYVVICKNENCRASKGNFSKTKEEAIKAWNTRKPMQNIVERLEENLQKIEEKRKMAESEADKLRFFNFEMALRKAVSIVREEGGIDGSNL